MYISIRNKQGENIMVSKIYLTELYHLPVFGCENEDLEEDFYKEYGNLEECRDDMKKNNIKDFYVIYETQRENGKYRNRIIESFYGKKETNVRDWQDEDYFGHKLSI